MLPVFDFPNTPYIVARMSQCTNRFNRADSILDNYILSAWRVLSLFNVHRVGFTSGLPVVYRACVETVYPPIQATRLSENEICDPLQLLQVVLTYFDPNQFINSRFSWNKHGPFEILFHMEIYSILRGCLPMTWGCVPEAKSRQRQGGKFRLDTGGCELQVLGANCKSWVGSGCKVDLDHKGLKEAIDQVKIYTRDQRVDHYILQHTAKAQNHCCTHPVHRTI